MNWNEVVKGGVIGGIAAIVIEFLVGWGIPSISYSFGFVALLVGGFVAGWIIKGKLEDAAVAGVVAGLIYIILGAFIIFPAVAHYHSANPVVAVVISIILGAVGGVVGNWCCCMQQKTSKSTKSSRKGR